MSKLSLHVRLCRKKIYRIFVIVRYASLVTALFFQANEMLLFNRTISASEAYACGLVAEIFPKETLMKEVYKRVHEFLDNPTMVSKT